MIVLLLVATFLFYSAFSNNPDKNFKYCLWLLFAVSAFRHPALSGWDMPEYYNLFSDLKGVSSIFSYETKYKIGYIALTALPKAVSDSFISFQIFYIAVCIILLSKIINLLELSGREKCLFLFGFFCYDFLWYFWETLRQNVADLTFFYLLIYLYKKKETLPLAKKIILTGCCAFIPYLFHSSSVVAFLLMPFLFFNKKEINPNARFIWVAIASILIFIGSSSVFSGIAAYMTAFDDRYRIYVNDYSLGSNIINIVFRLGFFYLYCTCYKENTFKYKRLILDATTLFVLVGSMSQGVASRMAEYYAFGFYVAMAFVSLYSQKFRHIVPLFFIALLLIFVRKTYTTDDGLNTSYYLFFQDPVKIPSDFYLTWKHLPLY